MTVGTSARRTAILKIAGRTFLRHGYADASMDGIAAEVGGSKSTLYRYFPSKAALFAAYVEEIGTLAWTALAAVDEEGKDPEAVLQDTARAYLDLILSPSTLAVTRLVMAETGRFPEIGRLFYERGIRRAEQQIAAILHRLAERSATPDRSFLALPGAAAHFRSLCEAGLHEECLWGVDESASREDVIRIARQAAACFLRGWPGQLPRGVEPVPVSPSCA
ncbi:TetR/AcrR family transcriptional regulator [Azospirillum sp. TSH100]|uniref:TetR/AcrR family transcriptional regulator n=1 Tax=Azospirillum sp. TSH100 TaxID=652764 RepID=UPI000D6866DC|nr:TetR/AcrR family transcriptional regulator [Azospirillum sp. TSH100]QCG86710.1 TetR/AcrR family transcriptional regulator [Azospirillum sp. TSH100]